MLKYGLPLNQHPLSPEHSSKPNRLLSTFDANTSEFASGARKSSRIIDRNLPGTFSQADRAKETIPIFLAYKSASSKERIAAVNRGTAGGESEPGDPNRLGSRRNKQLERGHRDRHSLPSQLPSGYKSTHSMSRTRSEREKLGAQVRRRETFR